MNSFKSRSYGCGTSLETPRNSRHHGISDATSQSSSNSSASCCQFPHDRTTPTHRHNDLQSSNKRYRDNFFSLEDESSHLCRSKHMKEDSCCDFCHQNNQDVSDVRNHHCDVPDGSDHNEYSNKSRESGGFFAVREPPCGSGDSRFAHKPNAEFIRFTDRPSLIYNKEGNQGSRRRITFRNCNRNMENFKGKKWLPGLGKVVRDPIDVKRNVPWSCHTNKELPFKVTGIKPTKKYGVIIPNVTKTKRVKKLDCVLYTKINKVYVKTLVKTFLYI